jgi:hypothetical protein
MLSAGHDRRGQQRDAGQAKAHDDDVVLRRLFGRDDSPDARVDGCLGHPVGVEKGLATQQKTDLLRLGQWCFYGCQRRRCPVIEPRPLSDTHVKHRPCEVRPHQQPD